MWYEMHPHIRPFRSEGQFPIARCHLWSIHNQSGLHNCVVLPNIGLDLLRHSHSRLVFNVMKFWVLASRSALRTWHIHTTLHHRRDISDLSAMVFSDACTLDPTGVQTDAVHHHFQLARSARVTAWCTDAMRVG